jgi:hypothetical protein
MDCSQLRPNQIAIFKKEIDRQLRYLGRARRRLELLGFPPADPLYREVSRAFEAVHGLSIRLHYLSCGMPDFTVPQPVTAPSPASPGSAVTDGTGHSTAAGHIRHPQQKSTYRG